jgi:hypothetical protein
MPSLFVWVTVRFVTVGACMLLLLAPALTLTFCVSAW